MQITIDIPKSWIKQMKKEEFIYVDKLCDMIVKSAAASKGHKTGSDKIDVLDNMELDK